MRLPLIIAALFLAGCASMPDLGGGGLPLGKTGWQLSGGADFEKRVWFVLFSRPFGERESNLADSFAK